MIVVSEDFVGRPPVEVGERSTALTDLEDFRSKASSRALAS